MTLVIIFPDTCFCSSCHMMGISCRGSRRVYIWMSFLVASAGEGPHPHRDGRRSKIPKEVSAAGCLPRLHGGWRQGAGLTGSDSLSHGAQQKPEPRLEVLLPRHQGPWGDKRAPTANSLAVQWSGLCLHCQGSGFGP